MNPQKLIDQLEVQIRNGAPPERLLAMLGELRTQISVWERLLDTAIEFPPEPAMPDENLAAAPVWPVLRADPSSGEPAETIQGESSAVPDAASASPEAGGSA
jgi:hypothetical protein